MSEENNQEEGQEQQQENQEQEFSPIEQKAIEMGWRKDFEGDPDDFIDAKEFVRRKPLFDKIEAQNRKIKDMDKTVEALKTHYSKVKETEYKRALEALKAQKKQALVDGDADQLLEVDEAIAEVRAAQLEDERKQPSQQEIHPDFTVWVDRNKWYLQDSEMREMADAFGHAYKNSHPDVEPNEILKAVEQRVKKTFPEKFSNPKRGQPSAVEGSSNTSTRKPSKDTFELTDEQKQVMNKFVRQGVMTKEQYIADLKAAEGIA